MMISQQFVKQIAQAILNPASETALAQIAKKIATSLTRAAFCTVLATSSAPRDAKIAITSFAEATAAAMGQDKLFISAILKGRAFLFSS